MKITKYGTIKFIDENHFKTSGFEIINGKNEDLDYICVLENVIKKINNAIKIQQKKVKKCLKWY